MSSPAGSKPTQRSA